MLRRTVIIFGVAGILCLTGSVATLFAVCDRVDQIEKQNLDVLNSVINALGKYELVIRLIERRQTHIENIIVMNEQIRLTIEQLRAYNHPQNSRTVFARRNKNPKHSVGGRDGTPKELVRSKRVQYR